jgi:peroxiredoxin
MSPIQTVIQETAMTQTIPQMTFKTRVRDENVDGPNPFRWADVTSQQLFAGRKVVVFALPGAFTPTCSSTHLPGYEEHYQALREQGVDEVYCLSVNDAFSMFQWSQQLGVQQVKMLPDGNGDFSRGMGMLVRKNNLGFGMRSWRYSMLVEEGTISKIFSEAGKQDDCETDPFEVSDAATMLSYLKDRNLNQAA